MTGNGPIKAKASVLIVLLVLSLGAMWMLERCSRNRPSVAQEYHRPTGDTIVVAIELSPTGYTLTGDTVEGFNYEMLRAIAAAHNVPISFYPFAPLEYALNGLRNGSFDMVAATLPASKDLKDELLQTEDIIVDRQVLVRLKSDSVPIEWTNAPQMTLLKDTVWTEDSSPYRERLSNLSQELGDTIYVKSDPEYNAEHLVLLVALGEIKQAIVNENVARNMVHDYPQLDVTTAVSMSQFQRWLVAKSKSELCDSMNVWIVEFKQSPEYETLRKKYYSR